MVSETCHLPGCLTSRMPLCRAHCEIADVCDAQQSSVKPVHLQLALECCHLQRQSSGEQVWFFSLLCSTRKAARTRSKKRSSSWRGSSSRWLSSCSNSEQMRPIWQLRSCSCRYAHFLLLNIHIHVAAGWTSHKQQLCMTAAQWAYIFNCHHTNACQRCSCSLIPSTNKPSSRDEATTETKPAM